MYPKQLQRKSDHRLSESDRVGSRRTAAPPALRAGLAPLELVLALPLLLCVMALIVNFSHAATWKIRSATSARLAMWRHRPMWDADSDPNPVNYWPKSAVLDVTDDSRISKVDPLWKQPAISQGWITGPVFSAGGGHIALRDNRVNEMSEGVSKGKASVALRYPFLPAMGTMSMPAEHALLDSVWQYHSMGYSQNEDRRADGWWILETGPEWVFQRQKFLLADRRITTNPRRELMRPLDRDIALMAFFGPRKADFYSLLKPIYDNSVRRVRRKIWFPGQFLDSINGSQEPRVAGVSERMASAYLHMYQAELNTLQAQDDPPQARIAELELWIQQLTDFIAKLQQ